MNEYFNINIEFNHEVILKKINDKIEINQKGYVCVIDGNVLTTANKDESYKQIINNSFVNICDGSSIALLASKIYNQHFLTYTGPEIFSEYVKKEYKQYFLGNTKENLIKLQTSFEKSGFNLKLFKFEHLPIKSVKDFDYPKIAKKISEFSPDIIWISLGAPKQEIFISKLYPFIDKGILFAIGAAFNMFLGDKGNKRAPVILRQMHLEWLFRVVLEPKRIGKRAFNYLLILPRLILDEIKKNNHI